MFYTIYKVTNKINGKIYIGSHKTKYLDDGYMGSGKYLTYSIRKHGIENFEKEILFVFDNADEMYAKEAELVNEEFIAESNTYNLKVGGFGGFDYINSNGLTSGKQHKGKNLTKDHQKQGRKIQLDRFKTDQVYRKQYSDTRRRVAYETGFAGRFKGCSHTADAKAKIGAANSENQKGSKNSQYGTCWIHNNEVSKKIKKDDLDTYLNEGWIKGRKIKFTLPSST